MDPINIAFGLAQFVPGILKWVTGSDKSAKVAEKVVDIAKAVTGRDDGQMALEELKANPEAVLKFREAVMANETSLEQAYLADRADARKRDIEFLKAGTRNWRADLMVLLDALGLIGCLLALFFYRNQMPAEVVTLISTIASIFGLCLRDAHQFEFGSSRGSKEKDDLLSKVSR